MYSVSFTKEEDVSGGENKNNSPYILPLVHSPTIHTTPSCEPSTIKTHSLERPPQKQLKQPCNQTCWENNTPHTHRVSQPPVCKAVNKSNPVCNLLVIVTSKKAEDWSRQLLVLNMKIGKQYVHALVDCGSEGDFVSHTMVKKLYLYTIPHKEKITLHLADSANHSICDH